MRTVAVEPTRHIAIMAQHSQTFGPSELAELVEERRSSADAQLSPMFLSTAIDMVDGQEFRLCFTATSTFAAVVIQSLLAYLVAPIAATGVGSLRARCTTDVTWLSRLVAVGASAHFLSGFVARLRFRAAFGASRAIGGVVRLLARDAAALFLMLLVALALVFGSIRPHNNLIILDWEAKING